MKDYAYYNGVFTPYDSACIPLSDRSIFFSDAVYDVIIGSGKNVYQLDAHLDRLYRNAERIGLENPPDKSEIRDIVDTIILEAQADEFLLYVQLSTSNERRRHERCENDANVLITVTECKLPTELGMISAITLPDIRHGLCEVKTTNLLPAVLSVEEAKRRGADIAIFHKSGLVTEGSYANVCMLKDGTLITHPFDADILPGITQTNLETAAEMLDIPRISRPFTVAELYEADAVMITSTTKLIKLCTSVDGTEISAKAYDTVDLLFNKLRDDFYKSTNFSEVF